MQGEVFGRAQAILSGRVVPEFDLDAVNALAEGLTPAERGLLLPLCYRFTLSGDARPSRFADALAQRIHGWGNPFEVTAEGFGAAIAELVAVQRRMAPPEWRSPPMTADEVRDLRVEGAVWGLISGLTAAELGTGARAALGALLPLVRASRTGEWLRAVVAARLAGDADAVQAAVDKGMARIEGPLEAQEMALLLALPVLSLRDWVLVGDSPFQQMEPEDRHAAEMRMLDDLPGYADFAVEVVETALARLGAIAGRQTAYRADGAFPFGDCHTIGRAMIWGLHHGHDWCLRAVGPLWQMAALAPDPAAKTMPSQSLTIRLGHAAVTEPRPEALRALDAVAAACRHAGVQKKLDRFRKAARVALALRPERVLALNPAEPLAKDMVKPFALAVEGLLARPEPMAAPDWQALLGPGRKEGWTLAKALVWEVTSADGAVVFTALPAKGGWRDVTGALRPFSPEDAIRLWHPVETGPELAQAWRTVLEREGVKQPFLQAGREIYPLPMAEREGAAISRFAGQPLAAVPLVGLARVTGWRLGFQGRLHLTLAGSRFTILTNLRLFPGSTGVGTAVELQLDGPQTRLDQVPLRVLSEVQRKVDLLVSVAGRGMA